MVEQTRVAATVRRRLRQNTHLTALGRRGSIQGPCGIIDELTQRKFHTFLLFGRSQASMLQFMRLSARGVSDPHGLKNLLKQHDNGPAVSSKGLTTSAEAAGNIGVLSAGDCSMSA
ncbi:hypothetical protein EVAR_94575_1 [Eumeta japonica]|uniref:Uncharacterized protein n=1 Tax=Eumeta variegata TaxID=151549 RepID=A0A4C1UWV3_EUMVA|nr:hypothetical protein EVAR_94575_1 [Eumeta japonica]